jgi:hypothetical protein
VTGRPAEDFATIARRYAALSSNQRTLGNWLRHFAQSFQKTQMNTPFVLRPQMAHQRAALSCW